MHEVQLSEAEGHLSQLLGEVERGETVVITRDGRPIARIVPEQVGRREQVQKAIEAIRGLRKEIGTMSVEEILTARHEGHKI